MKFCKLILIFCVTIFCYAAYALDNAPLIPQPPSVGAKGYVLIDANSGYVIAQKNADVRMPPASLTKIMSLYLVADALKSNRVHLTDNVRISENAWRTGGSRMFAQVGSYIPVSVLVEGIAVASGNDGTVAMAEFIAGSEDSFVSLMNQTAAKLGMTNTHFMDSNGLPAANHYSSPADLGKLARAWIKDFPEYYTWFGQKWVMYNNIRQPNRNRLLWHDPSVDGFKTGHTDDAGYCLIASAKRNDMRIISVVMGEPSEKMRIKDSQALINFGFSFFETQKMFDISHPIANLRTYYGVNKETPVGAIDFYVTLPRGQFPNLKVNVDKPNSLSAAIKVGQKVGTITLTLNGQKIAEQPLVALQDNPKAGFFKRMKDHIAALL
jgi:D-alanyl-D-alanine carboxypeptidase (penicillin-binding protein 5/6)